MQFLKRMFSLSQKKLSEKKLPAQNKKEAEKRKPITLRDSLPPTGQRSIHGKNKDGVVPSPKSGRGKRLKKKLQA